MILRTLAALLLMAAPAMTATAGAAAAETAMAAFSRVETPSPHPPHSIGQSAKGCLSGAVALPESGPTWQAMRLGRNHYWGNPLTIGFIEDLSRQATAVGWRGLYVGDLSQPRGGPVKGHASHQTGLDVDIWYTPPPSLDLTRADRERLSAIDVSPNKRTLNDLWTPSHEALLKAAALDPRVNRIFVTGPIKIAMCAHAPDGNRAWLSKIRPWWGHSDHFHVRLNCPKGVAGCVQPDPLPAGDGCADATWWVTKALAPPDPNAPKPPPKPPLTLADLPTQCREVLDPQ